MQLFLTTHNQEQHKFDFTTTLYQAVTVAMEGKEIVINLDTGQVDNRVIDREGKITTAEIAAKFEQHQKRRGLAKITMASYRSVLVALADVAPEWPPRIEDIEVLFDSYRTKKRSPVTLSEYWVRLNTWFKWAWEMGYIGSNPMRQVTRPELPHIEAGVISPKDFIKVIKHLRQVIDVTEPRQRSLPHERAVRDLAIIRFTYSTGLRVGEVAGLKMDDLDLPNQIVTIRGDTSKGKKTRDVCVGKQACRSLEDWLQIRPEHVNANDQVFISTRGNGWYKKPLTASGIYHTWRDRQEQAKIGPYKFHEIRHSHITHSMDNGIPIHHVSRQAGHSSADITLRIYTHSKDPERKRAYSDKNPDDALET